jgi:hypothetical protein
MLIPGHEIEDDEQVIIEEAIEPVEVRPGVRIVPAMMIRRNTMPYASRRQ